MQSEYHPSFTLSQQSSPYSVSNSNLTRYKYAKDRSQRMVVIPRYEPVFVEPNLKEYETQVLQMSMAIDDHDSADLKIDFSARNHVFDPAFNLDSVSYITHETSTSKLQEDGASSKTFQLSIYRKE